MSPPPASEPVPYLPQQATVPVPIQPGTLLQVVRGDHVGAFVVFCGSERDGEVLRLNVYFQGLKRAKIEEFSVDAQDVFPVGRPKLFWMAKFPDAKQVGPTVEPKPEEPDDVPL